MAIILSGYSSRIFEINKVPIPEPVPPPREWVIWNPGNWVSHDSFATLKGRTLEALSALSFLPHDIEHLVNELGTLGIVYDTRVK